MIRRIPLKILVAAIGLVLGFSSSGLAAEPIALSGSSNEVNISANNQGTNKESPVPDLGAAASVSMDSGSSISAVSSTTVSSDSALVNKVSSEPTSSPNSPTSSSNAIFIGPDIMRIGIENSTLKSNLLNQAGNVPGLQLGLEIIDSEGRIVNKFTQGDTPVSTFQETINNTSLPDAALIRIFAQNAKVFLSTDDGKNTEVNTNTYGYYFRVESGKLLALSNDIIPNLLTVKKNATQVQITGKSNPSKALNLLFDGSSTPATVNETGDFSITLKLSRSLGADDNLLLSYGDNIYVKVPLKLLAPDPYFFTNNIWDGPSFKLIFNLETNKLVAERHSGHFGNDGSEFFRLALYHSGETTAYYSYIQGTKEVQRAINELNGKSFTKGDILGFRVGGPLSGKSHFMSNEQRTNPPAGTWIYYTIGDNGLTRYDFPIEVNPMPVYRGERLSEVTVKGTTSPDKEIKVEVNQENNTAVTTRSDSQGAFQVKLSYEKGFNLTTPIRVSLGDFSKVFYIQRSTEENIRLRTDSGYEYVLNASLDEILKPLPANTLYAYRILSPDAQKAWDIAQRAILNATAYKPYDNNGNTYIDVIYPGLSLTKNDIDLILKYLVRSDPRMFLLKDWSGTPLYQGSKIIGQKFIIGNGVKSPEDFHQRLQKIEVGVSDILQYITPEMDVYQIVKVLETRFENNVQYRFHWADSDIRGAFIDKFAICGGYSKGIEYLLLRVGIENIWVQGFVGGGGHAWNLVNIYNNWYLADTTWGGQNWYLMGQESPQFVNGRTTTEVYRPMPTLSQYTIPWNAGDLENNLANNMGIVGISENDNVVTITYDTRGGKVQNQAVALKTSLDQYQDLPMQLEDGVWTYRLNLNAEMANEHGKIPFDFFFKVADRYHTAGNIRVNQLENQILANGMNNVVYTAHYIDLAKRDLERQVDTLYENAKSTLVSLGLAVLENQSYQEKLSQAKTEYLKQLETINAAENTTFIPAVQAGFNLILAQAKTALLTQALNSAYIQTETELAKLVHEDIKSTYSNLLTEQKQGFQTRISLLDGQVTVVEIQDSFTKLLAEAQMKDAAETEREKAEREQAEREQAEKEQNNSKDPDKKPKPDGSVHPNPVPKPEPNQPNGKQPNPESDKSCPITFTDVPKTHGFYKSICWFAQQNITKGYADGSFRPEAAVERGAMAAFLYRLAGSPVVKLPKHSPFNDVSTDNPFYKEIIWLASTKITTGYADGSFRPNQAIERQAMAAFLYRYNNKVMAKPIPSTGEKRHFTDIAESGFQVEIDWLARTGISTGWSDGTFRPNLAIERQAMAAFIERMNRK